VLKTITDVSPITYNKDGTIDYIFSSMLLTYNVLNITDLVLTRRGLDLGYNEGNPLMMDIVKNRPWDLVFKTSVMLGANYLFKYAKAGNGTFAYIMVAVIIVVYSYVNYMNYRLVVGL
jgi:hypothetical protein